MLRPYASSFTHTKYLNSTVSTLNTSTMIRSNRFFSQSNTDQIAIFLKRQPAVRTLFCLLELLRAESSFQLLSVIFNLFLPTAGVRAMAEKTDLKVCLPLASYISGSGTFIVQPCPLVDNFSIRNNLFSRNYELMLHALNTYLNRRVAVSISFAT